MGKLHHSHNDPMVTERGTLSHRRGQGQVCAEHTGRLKSQTVSTVISFDYPACFQACLETDHVSVAGKLPLKQHCFPAAVWDKSRPRAIPFPPFLQGSLGQDGNICQLRDFIYLCKLFEAKCVIHSILKVSFPFL